MIKLNILHIDVLVKAMDSCNFISLLYERDKTKSFLADTLIAPFRFVTGVYPFFIDGS
jgi:hypothetical protein